jgi:hypothetical protein
MQLVPNKTNAKAPRSLPLRGAEGASYRGEVVGRAVNFDLDGGPVFQSALIGYQAFK